MGTVLLSAGTAGKRFALPHATIHMHQALGGARGQASDIEIAARELLRNNEIIRGILAQHTGQPLDRIKADTDRDFYLDADQAKEYGLVDDVLHANADGDAQRRPAPSGAHAARHRRAAAQPPRRGEDGSDDDVSRRRRPLATITARSAPRTRAMCAGWSRGPAGSTSATNASRPAAT